MKHPAKLLLCLALCLALLTGCQKGETFVCEDLTLQLPEGYLDLQEDTGDTDADFLLGRDQVVIKGIAEDKAPLQEASDMTLQDYGELLLEANGLTCSLEQDGELYRFTYEASVDGVSYAYAGIVWEGDVHYWTVQIYCPAEVFTGKQQEIQQILDSVS